MKLECSRKDFADALSLAGQATSVRTSLPILMTILLEADSSSVRVLGCDGEMWAERKILANVTEQGSVCISYAVLQALIASLPDGQISFELVSGTLVLRHGQSEWKLTALPAQDFPLPLEVSGSAELRMPMGELRASVDGVAYAVADDNSRPVLTGVLFTYDGAILTLVATDTHRLAVVRLERDGIGSSVNAIVPEKALKAIKSLPIADDEEVVVKFDENRLGVDAGTASVVAQLLSGAYPNWERVIPSEHTRTWTIDRDELINNVNRAMILAKDNANRVRFTGNSDMVVIGARSEDKGEAKEEVPIISSNGDIEIAFNGRYVLDALKAMKTDGIRAEMTEPARPAVFRPLDGGEQQLCVIMPMALG